MLREGDVGSGLGKKPAICHGPVPAGMLVHKLAVGSAAHLAVELSVCVRERGREEREPCSHPMTRCS